MLLGVPNTATTEFWSAPAAVHQQQGFRHRPDAYRQLNDYRQVQRGARQLRTAARPRIWPAADSSATRTTASTRRSPATAQASLPSSRRLPAERDYTVENTTAAYREASGRQSQWTLTANGRYDLHRLATAAPLRPTRTSHHGDKAFDVGSWRAAAIFRSHQPSPSSPACHGVPRAQASSGCIGSLTVLANVQNNPDLKPEQTRDLDMGVRTRFEAFNVRASLEVTAFVLDRRDFILDSNGQYAPNNTGVTARYENIGGARHQGLEVALKAGPREPWSFDLAYLPRRVSFTHCRASRRWEPVRRVRAGRAAPERTRARDVSS
jgi:iron complex outermembrane receptor protein